ncbi:hypothetical protein F5Y15DRAFT_3554 [Xylariaceae sp. FL0016]|nr:hypothetical protein F5Y15DRAFT_3554 [Xylariaceae sp. FL0016]
MAAITYAYSAGNTGHAFYTYEPHADNGTIPSPAVQCRTQVRAPRPAVHAAQRLSVSMSVLLHCLAAWRGQGVRPCVKPAMDMCLWGGFGPSTLPSSRVAFPKPCASAAQLACSVHALFFTGMDNCHTHTLTLEMRSTCPSDAVTVASRLGRGQQHDPPWLYLLAVRYRVIGDGPIALCRSRDLARSTTVAVRVRVRVGCNS